MGMQHFYILLGTMFPPSPWYKSTIRLIKNIRNIQKIHNFTIPKLDLMLWQTSLSLLHGSDVAEVIVYVQFSNLTLK